MTNEVAPMQTIIPSNTRKRREELDGLENSFDESDSHSGSDKEEEDDMYAVDDDC